MKRALIMWIVLLLALNGVLAVAEEAAEPAEAPVEVVEEAAAEETAEETAEGEEAPEEEAQPRIKYDYNELTVGTATPFSGAFFSSMWGNNSSDLDVRLLVHGYNLIEWKHEDAVFGIDPSVVSGIYVAENGAGDRIYQLSIYQDLVYSDGTPITARDYAFSILLSIAPEVTEIGGSARAMDYLVGYADYVSGAANALAGVRVLDDYTLSITISNEYLPFFYELALLDCMPYPIGVIAPGCEVRDDGEGVYIANIDDTVEEPIFTADLLAETLLNEETGYLSHPGVGCGPYKLVSFDGTTAELEINENYKGNSAGLLPRIPKLIFTCEGSQELMDGFAAGEVGLVNKAVSSEIITEGLGLITGGDQFTQGNYTRNGMSFISFACEQGATADVRVRQAIAMCLDKDGMVNDTVGTYGLRVDGYYGMGQWMVSLVDGTELPPVEEPAPDADEATIAEYDATMAEWEALTMDEVPVYDLDVEGAVRLLEEAGWTLGADGEAYDPETDEVRYRENEAGELEALELTMVCPEGSVLNGAVEANFTEHLSEAGVKLNVEEAPMPALLSRYYRHEERGADMFMLATNFDAVFDPSIAFRPDEGEQINYYNPTGIADEALYEAAVDMRRTEAGDVLSYCQKWITFEQRFQ